MNRRPLSILRCSFCEKPETSVTKLLSGAVCQICDECVELCVEILAEEGVALHVETSLTARELDDGVVLALRTDQIAQSN
jgi:ATP-dependent Clp protease ATP-binding subunit ClpX